MTARWGALAGLAGAVTWSLPMRELKRPFAAACALAAVVAAVSAMWSIDPALTISRAASFALLLWIVVAAAPPRLMRGSSPRAFAESLAPLSGVILIGSLLLWLVKPSVAVYAGDLRGLLENANGLGLFLGLTFPFVVVVLEIKRLHWLWFAVVVLIYISTIALAHARTGLLVLFAGIFVYCIIRTAWRRLLVTLAIFVATTAVSLAVSSPSAGERPQAKSTLSRLLGARDEAWSGTVRLIRRRPLVGYGFGTADHVFTREPNVTRLLFFQGNNPANGYLQVVLECGGLGLLLLMPLGVALWTFLADAGRNFEDPARAAFFAMLVSGLIGAMFESVLTTAGAPWSPLIWLAAAAAPAGYALTREVPARYHRNRVLQRLSIRGWRSMSAQRQPHPSGQTHPRRVSEEAIFRVPQTTAVETREREGPSEPLMAQPYPSTDKGRWVFYSVILVVVVLGIVALFAIYTWGWRGRDSSSAGEEARARAFAGQILRSECRREVCFLRDVKRIARGLWIIRMEAKGNTEKCYLVDLKQFVVQNRTKLNGAAQVSCGARAGPDVLTVGEVPSARAFLSGPATHPTGFEVAVVRNIVRRLKVSRVHWVRTTTPRLVATRARALDFAVGHLEPSVGKQRLAFSVSYFHDTFALLIRAASRVRPTTDKQLARLRLGAWQSDAYVFARTHIPLRKQPVGYLYDFRALAALSSKRIDGIVGTIDWVTTVARQRRTRFAAIARLATGAHLALAFEPGSLWTAEVNSAIKSMQRDGTLARIQERWFPGLSEMPVIEIKNKPR